LKLLVFIVYKFPIDAMSVVYIFQFIIINFLLFLFIGIISIFGFILFYLIKIKSKKNFNLNPFELLVISFVIGLSLYITLCLILDIFKFINFYSAYLSIVIVDIIFISLLIYKNGVNKELLGSFIQRMKNLFSNKKNLAFIIIIIFILTIQIIIQWEITAKKFPLFAKDPYFWLGETWYLLENGFSNRKAIEIFYPRIYIYFTSGILLIYPDYYISYFLFKFGGISLLSFYILILANLLNKSFRNYSITFIGLIFVLMSNFLISRLSYFISSSIPVLLILICLVIINSDCPNYFIGFLIPLIYLFNPLYGFFFYLIIVIYYILKLLNLKLKFVLSLIKEITLIIGISIFFFIPYFLHLFLVSDITLFQFIEYYIIFFGFYNYIMVYISPIFLTIFPKYLLELNFSSSINTLIGLILDIERRSISYFFLIILISLIFPIKKFKDSNLWDLMLISKISIFLLLSFYINSLLFLFFGELASWFSLRALEALSSAVIIMACFIIYILIQKAAKFTHILYNRYEKYKNTIDSKKIFKILRIENLLLITLIISSFTTFIMHRNISYGYIFSEFQVKTIFFIKENIPEDSKIMVAELPLYDLLKSYDLYFWNFENDNITEIENYVSEEKIEYLLLDLTIMNSTLAERINNETDFDIIYENNHNILFEIS